MGNIKTVVEGGVIGGVIGECIGFAFDFVLTPAINTGSIIIASYLLMNRVPSGAIFGLLYASLYYLFYKKIPTSQPLTKGLVFGLILGLFSAIPWIFPSALGIRLHLVKIFGGIVSYATFGIVLGWWYGKKLRKSSLNG